MQTAERRDYSEVVLGRRLRDGLATARAEIAKVRSEYEIEASTLVKERAERGKGPNKVAYLKRGIVTGMNLSLQSLDALLPEV